LLNTRLSGVGQGPPQNGGEGPCRVYELVSGGKQAR
jgi:hypothetical protein